MSTRTFCSPGLAASRTAACWAATAALTCLPAHASPVSSVPGGVATTVLTFAPYDGVTAPAPGETVDVGAAEGQESVFLTFNDPDANHILGAVPFSFGSNGTWPVDGAYAGLNQQVSGFMTFAFTRGLSFVGGFVNYDPDAFDGTTTLTALDESFSPIAGEEIALDFDFGDANASGQGMFFGFARDSADIWGFQLSNGKVAIDNLTFDSNATGGTLPEPTSAALVLAALAALAAGTRRRR